jgi:hypothetical protein
MTSTALAGDRPWEESPELRRPPLSSRAPLVPAGMPWGISAGLTRALLVLRRASHYHSSRGRRRR